MRLKLEKIKERNKNKEAMGPTPTKIEKSELILGLSQQYEKLFSIYKLTKQNLNQ